MIFSLDKPDKTERKADDGRTEVGTVRSSSVQRRHPYWLSLARRSPRLRHPGHHSLLRKMGVWQRTSFGTRGSQVQILPLRPVLSRNFPPVSPPVETLVPPTYSAELDSARLGEGLGQTRKSTRSAMSRLAGELPIVALQPISRPCSGISIRWFSSSHHRNAPAAFLASSGFEALSNRKSTPCVTRSPIWRRTGE
jgi:hypothetical protein